MTSGQLPDSRLFLLVGSGAVVLILALVLVMRRRRGRGPLEKGVISPEMDEKLLNYVNDRNGAISMSKASKDLGISTEDLGEAIMRLKADGKLQGG